MIVIFMIDKNKNFEKYFFNQIVDFDEATLLSPNIGGNKTPKLEKCELKLKISELNQFCSENQLSENILFLASVNIALTKFNFSSKNLIFHENNIPFACIFENRDISVKDYLDEIKEIHEDNLRFINCPVDRIIKDYNLKPEFYCSFNQDLDVDSLNFKYSTYLNILESDGEFILSMQYNDQLYSQSYINLFLESIQTIINYFINNNITKLTLSDISLVEEYENVQFDEVELPFLHKRFEKEVNKNPDNIAIVASDATLTYGEFNKKANRIANALIKRGIGPKSNVLVMLPRTSDLIASIMGILKAGCAFIPIDLEYPKDRIDYIYTNSQADYIISNTDEGNSLNIADLLNEEDTNNPDVDISENDTAYMIYTSGSTGNPKGVMISHENICNQVQNPKSEYSSLLCLATISFDVSLDDILTSLSNGLKLILASDTQIKNIPELIKLLNDEKPEVSEVTPSRLASYLEVDGFCRAIGCLKCVFMGGEAFSTKVFETFRKYSDAIVYNSYGPTETTITSNNKEVTDVNDITVGLPLHNYVTDVRDIDGKLLPSGVMGELYIGGVGVGKGYYNMPEKTEEVFLAINDIPYYRSGDYAVALANGEIDIKGRIDNQIKLRGLRIEIGEIESNISNFPNIKQNVVVIKEIRNNEHLCAYFTAEEQINKDELKEYLLERLTQYMVPTVFMQVDEMPQTPNGKTDIKALPEPKLELNYVAPETKLEQTICAIYSSILDVEIVGAEDNFFEIGGTSLIASKLIIELLKQDYDVKYDDIFRNQTPRKLASFLSGDEISDDLDIDIIENYDYTTINKLLEKNTFKSFAMGENKDIGNVLLTGVTGFLGIHVLYEYIKNEDGIIYCMLRKGKFDSCEERLADLMDYYFDEDFTDLIGSRIILSEGDITNSEDFNKLDDYHIDTLINCAAIVKHYTHDDYIFRVNVDGVVNGLNFAEANDATYVQISTTSVIDEYVEDADVCDVVCDERTLYWGQDLSNKYLNSKFLAERMVLEKAVNGLDVKIIRVGNLMARYSDGIFQKNFDTNAFLNNIKAIKNLKAINPSLASEMVEISPIDCVAKATLLLSTTPKDSTIFHCENDKLISNQEIIDALNSFGFDIKNVSSEEFKEIYEQNMNENIQGIITADLTLDDLDFDEEGDDGSIVKMDQTLDILDSLGFEWPVIDEDYLKRFIKFLNEVNYFD